MSTSKQLTAEGVIVDSLRRLVVARVASGQADDVILEQLTGKALDALRRRYAALPGGAELAESYEATVRGAIASELRHWRGARN